MILNKNWEIIEQLFSSLTEQNIPYVILRNFESLPKSTLGGDVDLVVDYQFFGKFNEVLDRLANTCGFKVGTIQRHYHGVRFCLFKEGGHFFLKLDVHFGEYWRGIEYLSGSELISNSIKRNGLSTLSQVDESLLCLVDSLLTAGRVKEKYLKLIYDAKGLPEFSNKLERIVGRSLSEIIQSNIQPEKISLSGSKIRTIRVAMWLRGSFSKPISSLVTFFKYLKYEFERRRFPLGRFVVFDKELKFESFSQNQLDQFKSDYYPGLSVKYIDKPVSYDDLLFIVRAYNIVFISRENLSDCIGGQASVKERNIKPLILTVLNDAPTEIDLINAFDLIVSRYAS